MPTAEHAYVYDPTGRCVGRLPWARLIDLRKRYFATREAKPHIHAALGGQRPFEENVARLLARNAPSTKRERQPAGHHRDLAYNPSLLTALSRGLNGPGPMTERIATPLTVHYRIPSYYSPDPEDALFGATHDPYSTLFTGLSIAHPADHATAVARTTRWALEGAETEANSPSPTITILLLPYGKTAPYQRYLDHPLARSLGVISATHTANRRVTTFGANSGQSRPHNHGTEMILVANHAGMDHYRQNAERIRDEMQYAAEWVPTWETPDQHNDPAPHTPPENTSPTPTQSPTPTGDTPSTPSRWLRRRARTVHHRPAQHPPPPDPTPPLPEDTALYDEFTPTRLLKYSGGIMAYTDGSCIKRKRGNTLGAGVWLANAPAGLNLPHVTCTSPPPPPPPDPHPSDSEVDQATDSDDTGSKDSDGDAAMDPADGPAGTAIYVQPNGLETTNTITRAEASAVKAALSVVGTSHPQPLYIFTDSLAVLCLIRKMIIAPDKLHISKHRALFSDIVDLVEARANAGLKTHLCKVKSHIGVSGNEKVDSIATAMARGGVHPDYTEDACNQPYDSLFWPKQVQEPGHYVSDLNQDTKKKVAPVTACGYTRPTLYTEGWHGVCPKLCHKASHRLHTDTNIPWSHVLTGMKTRHGTVWNAKLARMCKKQLLFERPGISDGLCPACGSPDGTGHIMGGCTNPDMKKLYINRHNKGVLALTNAIASGRHGSCYMILDACAQADLPAYAADTRPPGWLLPDAVAKATGLTHMRPDVLIIPTLTLRTGKRLSTYTPALAQQHTIHILEVGYTSDTNHEAKTHDKAQQHQRLKQLLEEHGWKVKYHALQAVTLGFGGTIRADLRKLLTTLGCEHTQADRCCNKLHSHALAYAHSILCERRRLERALLPPNRQPRPGRPPP
jgi:ribonuclease HI